MSKKRDTISGNLFSETANKAAAKPAIAIPSGSQHSASSSTDQGESSGTSLSSDVHPIQHEGGLKDQVEPVVDPRGGDSEAQPNDFTSSVNKARGAGSDSDPLTNATKTSKNSGSHDGTGIASPPSADTIVGPSIDTDVSQPPQHVPDELAVGETLAAGTQPNGCKSFDSHTEATREPNSFTISDAAEQSGEQARDSSTEALEPTVSGLLQGEEEQAALSDRTEKRRDETDSRPEAADQSRSIETLPRSGSSEQIAESNMASLGPSGSEEGTEGHTPATSRTNPKKHRQSHPKVITKERVYLGATEKEILDQLIALSCQQYGTESSRTDEVEAGYSDLLTKHATCTKTVQRNIPKLVDKGFIVRTNRGNKKDTYRIKSEQEVEKARLEKGLTHYVEIGPGRRAVSDPEKNTDQGE